MVEWELAKLSVRVQFPLAAPYFYYINWNYKLMINYLDLDQINSLLSDLKKEGWHTNQFNNIVISNFIISISGGTGAFSDPKEFLSNFYNYKKLEVELIEFTNHSNRIIKPLEDDRFKNFSWTNYFHYLNINDKFQPSSIGAYVPREIISIMIRDIYKVSKLKAFF